jgi:hypothetical protein
MKRLRLFKKYPRAKKICRNCQTSRWGLMRPNYPFCGVQCRTQFIELPSSTCNDIPAWEENPVVILRNRLSAN